MAFGDLKGTLTGSANSITNPMDATGSVVVAVGDLVFVTLSQQTNLTATTPVTDNLGNTYAAINAGTDAGTVTIRSYYSRVTVAGTLTVVHVPATASVNDASVVADVIEGPFTTAPLDANPANTTDGTTPFDCPPTGTLAQANEVIMAAIALAGNQTPAATSPGILSGTVARANASTAHQRIITSSTSTVTPQFTGTSVTAGQVTASFKRTLFVAADAGSYSLSGTDATPKHTWKVAADVSSYSLTGANVTLRRNLPLVAEAGSYSLVGTDAALLHKWKVVADPDSYTLVGTDVTLTHGGGGPSIAVQTGMFMVM